MKICTTLSDLIPFEDWAIMKTDFWLGVLATIVVLGILLTYIAISNSIKYPDPKDEE
jgi:hypothetical protein